MIKKTLILTMVITLLLSGITVAEDNVIPGIGRVDFKKFKQGNFMTRIDFFKADKKKAVQGQIQFMDRGPSAPANFRRQFHLSFWTATSPMKNVYGYYFMNDDGTFKLYLHDWPNGERCCSPQYLWRQGTWKYTKLRNGYKGYRLTIPKTNHVWELY